MSKSDEEAQLYEELDEWLKWRNKQWDDLCSPARTVQTPKEFSKLLKSGHQNNAVMAQEARSFIPRLFCDNSHLSAEELEELASKLSPGSSHTGGWLASLVYNSLRWEVDPILIAATIRWNWHGGRGRFEFLPDPAESDTQDYQGLASDLIEFLQDATDRNPRRILTGEDREFYESLPEMFTVYRGCAGISSEMAAAGVCWTIKRDVAEWFAYRSGSKGRLVMTARVNKKDIAFVKATEFEIAMQPRHARQIKCREHPDTWHPKMGGLS